MYKVFSFVKLDWCLMKAYWKALLIMLGLGLFLSIGFKSAETLSSYLMVMLTITMSYPFAIGEKNKLDILYGTLSLNRKDIVIGRYTFILIFMIASSLISLVCSIFMSLFLKQEFNFLQIVATNCIFLVAICIIVGIQYPIYFKYGYTKAKSVALIPLFMLFGVFLFAPMLGNLFNLDFSLTLLLDRLTTHAIFFIIGILLFGAIVLVTSCYISLKIYNKKDI